MRGLILGLKQGFDSATEGAGERLKGDRGGAVDVLGVLLVLLDVADVHAGKGGEFALGKPGGETLAMYLFRDSAVKGVSAQRAYSTCVEFTVAIRILCDRVQHERRNA